ncbi:MAG: undecaprenyldiphospho-muramoylpentapeptide beta-N-acetylglucosaminyltransferase [Planctomycetaceae bacterium]
MATDATFVLAGGGTGGHLFPGIAVAEAMLRRAPDTRILFAGSERSLERDIVEREGFSHASLPSMPSTSWKRNPFLFGWNNWSAYRAARALLQREKPRAVIGLGGFASVPVVIAARRMRIPVVLLEQNVVPGRATSWLSRGADRICISFPETASRIPSADSVAMTGNPVRGAIAELANQSVDVPEGRERTLLVLGGSQGSQAVNAAVLAAVEKLQNRFSQWRIIHQTGASDVELVQARYRDLSLSAHVEPFLNDMVSCYREATFAVARAGATTLAELACAGCPVVLIPYPGAIGDHQTWNARAYESAGAAKIVAQRPDAHATAADLTAVLESLSNNSSQLDVMRAAMRSLARPGAANAVVDAICQLVQQEQWV